MSSRERKRKGRLLGAQPEAELEFILEFGRARSLSSSSTTTVRGCGVHQVGPKPAIWAVLADGIYHVPHRRWIVVDILRASRATCFHRRVASLIKKSHMKINRSVLFTFAWNFANDTDKKRHILL